MERFRESRTDTGMRRIFALMLIATSGWLMYQTANTHLGGVSHLFSPQMMSRLNDLKFAVPAGGALLGLLGGLTVFFNGPGGAALAIIGGIAVAGFTVTLKQTFELDHILDNEMAVGATMLMLAIMTASMTRATPRASAKHDDTYSSGRRVF
jgi:hypothetical protein